MASQHQPVVVVFDDLQWADKASLLLLAHLAAADPAMRVLVLGTYRDSELSTASALVDALARLRRHEGVSRIELVGLDDSRGGGPHGGRRRAATRRCRGRARPCHLAAKPTATRSS